LLIKNDFNLFQDIVQLLPENALQDETLLHLAIRANNEEAVAYLLKNKVFVSDINKIHPFKRSSALHMAAMLGNLKIVQLLIQHGSDITTKDTNNHTAFDIALHKTHLDICNILIDKNADRQEFLNAALFYAGVNNKQEIMESLIREGAHCNWRSNEWRRPSVLENAIDKNNITQINFLLEHGADANYNNLIFNTLQCPEILALLLKHLDDINVKSSDKTLLESVCLNKESPEESLKLLLEHGANIHAVNANHDTALHHAARQGNLNIIRYLITKGADPTVKNLDQQTPWEAYLSKCEDRKNFGFFDSNKDKDAVRDALQVKKPTPENNPDADSGCTLF
jgi:ankyrin repeat protein